ncbi:glycosyl transferase family 1 [Flavobacterium psychrolimnae]|uniref:Glycosyl transferase family 1 n=2 Tax=Flavobacterium psychrolimnae TaxID=249351 RepID=A0A366B0B8_9FLAO|nr:glycosyl transferase family 1 [Flavobacterium psychrolimnae]
MVSMPSLHFFRWSEQLQDYGHEVYWFDITDGGAKVERLHWVNQIVGWKLCWDFPGRIFLKINFPKLYILIQKFNERNITKVFEQKMLEIRPDIVHSFAIQIACIPILSVMMKHKKVKWVYSSWGSDMFYFINLNIKEITMNQALKRIDFLITDCNRDYEIAKKIGFNNKFSGVFPGNGGIDFPIEKEQLLMPKDRDTILIKAYSDEIGKGLEIIKSFDEELISLLMEFKIVLFGANQEIVDYIKNDNKLKQLNFIVYLKNRPIRNEELLKLMNHSYIYIANSLSDGLPNALLEAMGMGCFPIQSNPGNVMSEIIEHNKNGFLITNPLDLNEIKKWLLIALLDKNLINYSFEANVDTIRKKCNRKDLKDQIGSIYEEIYKN